MIRKLTPGVRGHSPFALKLSQDLVMLLPLRLQLARENEPGAKRAALKMVVAGFDFPDIDRKVHFRIIELVHKHFLDEFCRTVDQLHYKAAARQSKKAAIAFFRAQYGITEDDLPTRTSQRAYQRYEQRLGRFRPAGKPRGFRKSTREDLST